MIQLFVRKRVFQAALGNISTIQFDDMRAGGVIPEPDGYLGPRLPIWTQNTVQATQEKFLGVPRPVESRKRRARAEHNHVAA